MTSESKIELFPASVVSVEIHYAHISTSIHIPVADSSDSSERSSGFQVFFFNYSFFDQMNLVYKNTIFREIIRGKMIL